MNEKYLLWMTNKKSRTWLSYICKMKIIRFTSFILIQGDDTQFELSAEMAFMEQKLNTLKQTLGKSYQRIFRDYAI